MVHFPHSLAPALSSATQSIRACVVVGGSLFSDRAAFTALYDASVQGLEIQLLFPSPVSPWLQDFAAAAKIDPLVYGRKVFSSREGAAAALPDAQVRWYDAPGPCWFVLIDDRALFTKPFSATHLTVPIEEIRPEHIEHFGIIFEQLWSHATVDYNASRAVSTERPLLIQIVDTSSEILARLRVDGEELASLSAEQFEVLIADCLTAMGLGVQRVGASNTPDGGIDIIAWPECNSSFGFLLAVQVKHTRRKHIGPSPVRDLRGVLSTSPFDVGLMVTNARFSPSARWAAQEGSRIVRLRDFDDIVRWIGGDFAKEPFYNELPSEIALTPGLRIPITHKKKST